MLERTEAVTNKVLEPTTFFLAYPNVFSNKDDQITMLPILAMTYNHSP